MTRARPGCGEWLVVVAVVALVAFLFWSGVYYWVARWLGA